jgi:cytochrome c peroxidase
LTFPSSLWFDMLRLAALAVFSLVAIGGAFSARLGETPVLPATPYDYDGIELPSHLDVGPVLQWDTTPADNPITDAGATLGRVLFYDVRLSQNETVSCASCHRQEHGFSDPERLSAGFQGEPTARNSMALAFPRYDRNRQFFWDERAQTLEGLALEPIQDLVEMGMTLDELTARLEATAFYPDLFADAFGTPEVTSERVARALSQFIRSIVAFNSPYDAARRAQGGPPGRPLAGLTDQENRGLELFFGPGRCEQCHTGDLFMGQHPRSNGLDATVTDPGAGFGRFKTVSLRNVALTAPYMHDGRFETLEEVVDHYSTGVQDSPALDPRLRGRDGRPVRLDFSAAERAALVAFLNTLTDSTLTTDPRWSDPFRPLPTPAPSRRPAGGAGRQ